MKPRAIPPSLYGVHCAVVSLPDQLCDRNRPLQERYVFFEAKGEPGAHLEKLLALTWDVDTRGWCEAGWIYNVRSAHDRMADGMGEGNSRIFECGWGGPEGITYIDRADCDYLVTPRMRSRLEAAHAEAVASAKRLRASARAAS